MRVQRSREQVLDRDNTSARQIEGSGVCRAKANKRERQSRRRLPAVEMLDTPEGIGVGGNAGSRRGHAIDGDCLRPADRHRGQRDIADSPTCIQYLLCHLLIAIIVQYRTGDALLLALEYIVIEQQFYLGTGGARDDLDGFIRTANLRPVRDLPAIDALKLRGREIGDLRVAVDDHGVDERPHAIIYQPCTTGGGEIGVGEARIATLYRVETCFAAPTIDGEGSKTGLNAVESGNTSLAYSDLTSTGRAGLVDYRVGALIYAVIVNSDTQITNLTTAQLQSIYSGQITNWSQVGGTDEPIKIVSRSAGSEIELLFDDYVLKGKQQSVAGTVLYNDSNEEVAQKVLDTSGAISYVPLASVPVSGAQAISINGVAPSAASVSTNAYAFWSIEHLYSRQAATGLALSFISFCSTDTAALDLASAGVISIKDLFPAALDSHTPGPTI